VRPPPAKGGPRRDRYREHRPHDSRGDRDSYHTNKNYRDGYNRGSGRHYEHRDDRDYHRGKYRSDRGDRYNVPPRWANHEEGEGRDSS